MPKLKSRVLDLDDFVSDCCGEAVLVEPDWDDVRWQAVTTCCSCNNFCKAVTPEEYDESKEADVH